MAKKFPIVYTFALCSAVQACALLERLYFEADALTERDFEQVKLAAQRLRIIPALGNVVSTAQGIFAREDMSGKTLAFVNFTNIAQYLAYAGGPGRRQNGRAVLVALLSDLPICEQTVICDSSFSQQAMLYTPGEYSKFGV